MSRPADRREYTVEGMTCAHCVRSVHQEVGAVTGVQDVAVDLASGRMTVAGEHLEDDAIRAAVDEAGYGVAS